MKGSARLILICGLPGSGKTTLALAIEARLGAVRLCADEWMDALNVNLWKSEQRASIEALQWTLARRLLELGNTVIVEWGTWSRSERDTLRLDARALGAAVELHCLSASIELLMDRLEARGMEDPPITRDQMSHWFEVFEPPTGDEMALFDPPMVLRELPTSDSNSDQ